MCRAVEHNFHNHNDDGEYHHHIISPFRIPFLFVFVVVVVEVVHPLNNDILSSRTGSDLHDYIFI